ncbi:MAG: flippase-like domain-containing protein [Anaerolineales bacterium]|nr:flippase-like domain-containing protein [Anaerolineales bacterium]
MRNLWSKICLGLAFGLAVMIGLALVADVRAVGQTVRHFQWAYVPAILGLTLANYALRFVKWHYYARRVGARGLAWTESLRIFVAGFPLALSPGKIAEPLKAVWLWQASGVPVARGIPVVAAERLSDGLAVLLLSTLGVVAYPRFWPGFLLVLAGLLGIVIASQVRPLALWLLAWGDRLPVVARFSHHLRESYEGAYQLFRPRSTLVAVGLGLVSWLGEGIGFYLVLRGLGLPPSLQTASVAVFVLSFSTIVGAVSALPGGLGAAEASIAGLLAITLGLSGQLAAAATLLIRFFTLWFGVGLGLAALASARRLLRLDLQAVADQGQTAATT